MKESVTTPSQNEDIADIFDQLKNLDRIRGLEGKDPCFSSAFSRILENTVPSRKKGTAMHIFVNDEGVVVYSYIGGMFGKASGTEIRGVAVDSLYDQEGRPL